jgi:transcriptional regulator with XRE-family HTH domain
MDIQSVIGLNVAEIRRNAKLSQEELAHRIEVVAQTYVSRLEAGKCNPTAATLYLIAKALDVPIADLFSTKGIPLELVEGPLEIKSTRSGKKKI